MNPNLSFPHNLSFLSHSAHRPDPCVADYLWKQNDLEDLELTLSKEYRDEHTHCQEFKLVYLTRAVTDILHRLGMKSAIIIYTGKRHTSCLIY